MPADQAQDDADEGLVECRLCGRRCRSLGHHLRRAHGLAADEYRDQHGIRRGQPLTSIASRDRFRAAIQRQIDAGSLDVHYATNADRGPAARAESARVIRELLAQGATFAPSRKPAPREVIEAVIIAIEGGTKRAAAVAAAPISEAAFYANLARHPDLKARLAQVFRR
jgi:hypothetical protein